MVLTHPPLSPPTGHSITLGFGATTPVANIPSSPVADNPASPLCYDLAPAAFSTLVHPGPGVHGPISTYTPGLASTTTTPFLGATRDASITAPKRAPPWFALLEHPCQSHLPPLQFLILWSQVQHPYPS